MRSDISMIAICLIGVCGLLPAKTVFCGEIWTRYTSGNCINDIAVDGDYIWCATEGGLYKWNVQNETYEKFTNEDIFSTISYGSVAGCDSQQ